MAVWVIGAGRLGENEEFALENGVSSNGVSSRGVEYRIWFRLERHGLS